MSFFNTFTQKKILVTGNTGFKGAWLTTWLLKMEAKVSGLANGVPTQPSLFELAKHEEKVKHFKEDVRDLSAVTHVIKEIKPDFIFHLAAQPIVRVSYETPIDTIETNMNETLHILEALRHVEHPCIVILITSDKVYENREWVWGYRENDALGGLIPIVLLKPLLKFLFAPMPVLILVIVTLLFV